jgi:hypothetical protein
MGELSVKNSPGFVMWSRVTLLGIVVSDGVLEEGGHTSNSPWKNPTYIGVCFTFPINVGVSILLWIPKNGGGSVDEH